MEILQLSMLRPEMAVLDETDSGLDIDALRVVASGVNAVAGPDMGVLIITHYQRILHLVKPDFVHVMFDGRIVKEGGPELVDRAREQGLRLDPRGAGRHRLGALTAVDDLYREHILEHYRSPRTSGELADADLEFHDSNPLCGDELPRAAQARRRGTHRRAAPSTARAARSPRRPAR